MFNDVWDETPAYKNLIAFHLIIQAIYLLFLLLAVRSRKINYKVLHFSYCLSILAINVLVSINSQIIHERAYAYAYVICIYFMMTTLLFKNYESILILLVSWISLLSGYIFNKQSMNEIFISNVVNSFLVVVTAFLASRISYTIQVKEFLIKKALLKKSSELNNLNRILETRVEQRSKELVKTLEMDKLRTAFFTNISHELKTPLSVILSAEQLLDLKLKKLLKDDDYQNVKKQQYSIKQNSYRLIRIINNLIDMTRMDSDNYGFSFKNYDIVRLVKDVLISVSAFIESHKLCLEFKTSVDARYISCDADMIERVLLNLLANAVKFSHAGGTITVNIYETNNYVNISVKDTGIGIPYDMQKLIFERFVQVDSSLSRNREGSGIGLSLVKSIVDTHKGTIDLKSEPGIGSEFIFKLPVNINVEDNADKKVIESIIKEDRLNIEFADIYDRK